MLGFAPRSLGVLPAFIFTLHPSSRPHQTKNSRRGHKTLITIREVTPNCYLFKRGLNDAQNMVFIAHSKN